jgi:hypothetical protein
MPLYIFASMVSGLTNCLRSTAHTTRCTVDEPRLGLYWARWMLQMLALFAESRETVASPGPLLAPVMTATFPAMLLFLIIYMPDYRDTCPATAEKLATGLRIIGHEVRNAA